MYRVDVWVVEITRIGSESLHVFHDEQEAAAAMDLFCRKFGEKWVVGWNMMHRKKGE